MNASALVSRILPVALVVVASSVAPVHAEDTAPPKTKVSMQNCLATVLANHPGDALQVVLKMEGKQSVWEFEIESKDGKWWDVECSGDSGKIVEVEERVRNADAPAFKAKLKVTEADAKKTALAKYPGEIERSEYEIESDGKASYEFDIKLKAGGDLRVEVDATSGAIVEASREYIEIGRLPK